MSGRVGLPGSVAVATLLLAAAATAADNPKTKFQHLALPQGLSQVTIQTMFQDRQGYMWFGTQDGLNRFDGERVAVFKADPEDPRSLTDNLINRLVEDGDGQMWVITGLAGALSRYDPRTERFARFLHDPDDPGTPSVGQFNPNGVCVTSDGSLWFGSFAGGVTVFDAGTGALRRLDPDPEDPAALPAIGVSSIFQDRGGTVWVGTFGGGLLREVDEAGAGGRSRFTHYRSEAEDATTLRSDVVIALFEDRSGVLWVGTAGGGLHFYDRKNDGFTRFPVAAPGQDGLAGANVRIMYRPIVEDRAGALWVATDVGVSRIDADRRAVTNFSNDSTDPTSLGAGQVSALLEDGTGALWVGTRGSGLHRHLPDADSFEAHRNDAGDGTSLASDFVSSILEGRSGVLWIGTDDNGASRFSRTRHKFTHYAPDPTNPHGLTGAMVYAPYLDRAGTLWVGTRTGGLHRYDAARKQVVERYALLPGQPRDIGSNWVRAVLEDSQGRFWIGMIGGGVCLIDRDRSRVERCFRNDPADPESLSSNQVFSVFEDSRGDMWVGTGNGWNLLDPATGRCVRYLNDPDDPTSLGANLARFTFEDRAGTLWVGLIGGISRFDRRTETFTTYARDLDDPHSLGHDNVMDMLEDRDGMLWVATFGGGLNLFDPASGTFTHYTSRNGLASDSLYSVLQDDAGFLWVSSNFGISRFDPDAETFTNFDTDDGLQSTEFNGRAFFQAPDGEMFFGGINGFNVFRPSDIGPAAYQPPVVLTGFRKYGQAQAFDVAVSELDRVVLSWKDRYFTFEFAALDFDKPASSRYAYMLEGLDKQWIDNGTRRDARYTNVGGGRYVFKVKGASGDGVWNPEPATIEVVVIPPPWRTPWAYGLYALLGAAGVFGFVRYKVSVQEHRRKTEELERARAVQLAMLPDRPPDNPHVEITVHLRTATEVGGDYYDFFMLPDGSLDIVTGDATGHGMAAGMMVAMTRTALQAIDASSPEHELAELNRVIRAVNLSRLDMALNIIRVSGSDVEISSAGMPPAYVYRSDSGDVDEYLAPGVPLGGLDNERYQLLRTELRHGDVLVLISDGLPERLNARGDLIGYEAVAECIARHGAQAPAAIVEALLDLGERHAEGVEPADDITLMVVTRRQEGTDSYPATV